MNLSALLSDITALPAFETLLAELRAARRGAVSLGLLRSARLPVIAALSRQALRDGSLSGRPALVLTTRHDQALAMADEIQAWEPSLRVLPYPEPNPLFYEYSAWGPGTIRNRLVTLAALADYARLGRLPETPPVVVASARALMTRTLPTREFMTRTRVIRSGETIRLERLLEIWVGAGYEPTSVVVEPGQFSRRGGILDIWPPAEARPVRIELFGDEVDSLRHFDPATQRSGDPTDTVVVTPAREALPGLWKEEFRSAMPVEEGPAKASDGAAEGAVALPGALEFFIPLMYPSPAGLLDYLPQDALVLVDDWSELENTVGEFEEQAIQFRREQVEAGLLPPDFPEPHLSWSELQDDVSYRGPVLLSHPGSFVSQEDSTPRSTEAAGPATGKVRQIPLGQHFRPNPRFGGQVKPFIEHLEKLQWANDRTVVVTRQAQRLAELWGEAHTPLTPTDAPSATETLSFVQGALAEGWRLDVGDQRSEAAPPTSDFRLLTSDLHLLTDGEVFGWTRPERRRRPRPAAVSPETDFADFSPGDYVVHVEYGIGRFHGLVRRAVEGIEREYMHLEYEAGDEVFVPIHQADRVTRYVGAEDHEPALSRLGSADWSRTKERIRQAVEAVARDLLELYAKRETAPGHAFPPDTPWQQELEASFPYVETEDQLRAIREVKQDMERSRPMDRLICGDVGYGKTEVALRAAFKAVMDGKQVAVLVPTTVLAQQHLHTFDQRLSPFPVKIDMLSRFRSRAEQEAIIEKLASGEVDIVIGTHRLIQRDVLFRDLGLLIVDEEQRFGVSHKEFLKRMRTEVDVLTLTATPIPRTLYMSLTGVRDISTINTPPEERLPITTHVGPYSERLVRQAVLRELDRGGQVFFVHNRVQTIEAVRHKLELLVPEVRLGVAHGQMDEHVLSKVMDQFTEGEIDVLLCTSIIESGLDIPNANTLIVDRADTFGLAQLYQLRGRVGRGAMRAHAYFFQDRRHRPTPEALQRLETIAEQTELGAGYSIAMRDLEMRGAGDILGVRQHGHIAAVGFHLYTRLLTRAVQQLKRQRDIAAGRPPAPQPDLAYAGVEFGVSIDLPLPTAIPSDYVPDRNLRLRLYRRMAQVTGEVQMNTLADELRERFGPLPRPVQDLLFQLRVKLLAQRAGVEAVGVESGQIVVRRAPISGTDQVYLQTNLGEGVRVSKRQIWLPRATDEAGWRDKLIDVLERLAATPVEPAGEAEPV